ncbi:MAG TPA: dihydrolipoamide acetyltransferase family protein [Solirubrobacterales bacterium]|nr:dihydrolipoamide acetyltransferase family protein [Solirubrobacterales bacterium]
MLLPQMGLEVSEGTVTSVLVRAGQAVSEGETVLEVETDKAIAEVAAPRDGFMVSIDVEEGDTVPVGAVLARIGDTADEDAPAGGSVDEAAPAVAAVASPPEEVAPTAPATAETLNGTGRRRAAPIARRAASEIGIPLEQIAGTGPAGRITLGDVEQAAARRDVTSTGNGDSADGARLEPLSATRQSIARRLTESQLVPAYTLSRDIDVEWMLAEKVRLSAEGPAKVGVLDLLLQALAETLVRHPILAACFVPPSGDTPAQLRHPSGIDLGLAVATDRGLLVPAIRRVHELTLAELALERARLVELTRAGRLGLAEMGGAAATLSSLGTFGVDGFTAMLNPGESSILAVGRTVERAVPHERGIAVVPTITATFTFDHRVVDGAAGALALTELAELLEGGMAWRT